MYTTSVLSSCAARGLRTALGAVNLVESARSAVKRRSSVGRALLPLPDAEDTGTRVSAEAEKESRLVVESVGEDVADMGAVACAVVAEGLKPKRERKVFRRRICLRMARVRTRSRLGGGVPGASSSKLRLRCRVWRIKLMVAQNL